MNAPDRPVPESGFGGRHIPELDGVRAVSILLVLAAHALPLGPKSLALNAAAGLMGMSLFFCLSGFLITRFLMERRDVLEFFSRRLARIVPAAALYLTILLLILDLPLRIYLLNLAFVSNYVPGALYGGPVGHFWSLCVEMQFYMAIGLAVLLLGRRALWLVPPACLLVTALRIRAGAHVEIATHLRVDEILVGGCLALLAGWLGARPAALAMARRPAVALLAPIAALWFLSAHEVGGALAYLRPYFAGTLVALVVLADWAPLRALLVNRVMRYIATISYALYIYHPLMLWGVMNEGSVFERYLVKRPLSFAATWAAAHLSTVHWEKRWTAALRRRARPADAPGAPATAAVH